MPPSVPRRAGFPNLAGSFGYVAPGNPGVMTSPVPDEVPVADAIEQSRDAAEAVPDREVPEPGDGEAPLEASAADWQEQTADVDPDGDAEDFDRRD